MNDYNIVLISDSLGETAEKVARAVVEQFKNVNYQFKKYPFIDEEEKINEIVLEAKCCNSIIIFTTVLDTIRDAIIESCERNDIPYIDIMNPLMNLFGNFFNAEPLNKPGIIHKLDAKYFKKVEAVEFAVKYDDGKDPRGVKKADVVLIGISRTSKTPLSMYLAHKNIKVANIPLVPEVPVPKELFEADRSILIGLTTDPYKLNEIRKERLKALGLKEDSATYANMDRIIEELEYSSEIMKKLGCPVIDVSIKAVEETANIILKILSERGKINV